ncbi:VWA domain-containing protein [Haloferula sp. BvORR071]|uniref:VWA domain-containing protein n=1 Tax=Haloferula sp. BvORR071 TaxID=1396141 RepID=UPI0005541B5C|nr:VWA domain-containing protein [Haloferula sp. BvORR071]
MGDFHFLRPWWLLAVVPALLLAWGMLRHADPAREWRGIIADHLVPYLVTGSRGKRRSGPVLWMLAGWIVSCVALAGPAWKREPSPFADDVAALAVVMKISPSMKTEDIAPDRLTRSVQKVHDLLARRGASKAALIAYAGSAHVVMPATSDAGIIDSFAASLDPKIMPSEGDAAAEALKLADRSLKDAGGGSILWISDGIAPEQHAALSQWRKSAGTPVKLLAPLPDSPELASLTKSADLAGADVIRLTPDDSDISALERAAKFATPVSAAEGDRWQDNGYWLTPVLALLMLPFFRKGWMAPTAAKA